MSQRGEKFVQNWIAENVENRPDLEDFADHVGELVEELLADAEAEGIEDDELSETVGDPADYLQNAVEQMLDPGLGSQDGEEEDDA